MIVICPHCSEEVWPNADGSCPSCHGEISTDSASPVSVARRGDLALLRNFHESLVRATPRTFVTPSIVVANVAVFALMLIMGANPLQPTIAVLLDWGANSGPKTMDGQWWRLFTSMFLHGGIIHLGFNMWVLWQVGHLVERLVGNVGFALVYVLTGLLGSLASIVWNSQSVSVGASGAVFGIVGTLLAFILLRRDTVPPTIFKSMRSSLGMFLLYNLAFGLAVPAIDMAAHVGGLVAGIICGLVCSQPLSPEMTSGRVWRNIVVLCAGGGVVLLTIVGLPAAPPDIRRELAEVPRLEAEARGELNRLLQSQGIISDEKLLAQLDDEILPKFVEYQARIERALTAKSPYRDVLGRFNKYLKVRVESVHALREFLRDGSEERLREYDQLRDTADEMAEQVSSA